jgi:hypothetical protein
VYGTYSSNPQDNNIGTGWSINFETAVPGYDQFRFATGDGQVWLITTKAGIGGKLVTPNEFYAHALRDIIASSDSSTPYQARWYYRSGAAGAEDPWISVVDFSESISTNKIVYGQKSNSGQDTTNILRLRIGANVFIRKSSSAGTCVACPAGTTSAIGASSVNACVCSAGAYASSSANLVAWYKLNGDLTDSSGVTGSATNQGGTLAFAKDTNLASNLPYAWYAVRNGVDGVNYALTPALNRNVPLSFALWFKTTGSGAYTIVGYGDRFGSGPSIQFDWESTQLKVYTALSTQWNVQPAATGLAINTWYFAVYTLSGTTSVSAILYIDGTQRATGTGASGQTLPRFKDLTIGNSGDGGRGFAGQIADIRIYNKALTQDEVTALYTNMPDSLCASCPAGTTSAIGASSVNACVCNAGTYTAPADPLAAVLAAIGSGRPQAVVLDAAGVAVSGM